MKKLLLCILVSASLIACTNQETKKDDTSVDKQSGAFTSNDKKSAIIKQFIEGYLTGDTAINYPLVRTYYADTVKVFQHILTFRMRYFDKTPVGALVTRVVSDVEAITEVFSSGIMEIAGDLVSLIFVLALMFSTNWELSLMTLIPIPLLVIATRIFAKAMKASFQYERLQVTRLNTFVQEHITGMSIVQLFNRQKIEFAKFNAIK